VKKVYTSLQKSQEITVLPMGKRTPQTGLGDWDDARNLNDIVRDKR